LRFGGDRKTINDEKGQTRVLEALLACLLLVAGLSATTFITRVNVSVDDSNLQETGENIFDVLCDRDVISRIMEGGEFSEAQLKTLITTLLPPGSEYSVTIGSSMTNETFLNATNMGSSTGYNAFAGFGTVTISLPIARVEIQEIDVMLVMDRSGSMQGEKINSAKAAAKTFVDQLNMSRDRVGLASFADEASLDCHLTNNTVTIKSKIDSLVANGYTNIGGGISKSNEEFVNYGRPDAIWVMILLSDGEANRPLPESSAKQYAIDQAECAKILEGKGVRIYTIGLGSPPDLDEDTLRQIAFDESKYFHAPTADDLESIYIAISKDILLQVRYDIVTIQLNLLGSG
jgi:uncharacterized protein YegL